MYIRHQAFDISIDSMRQRFIGHTEFMRVLRIGCLAQIAVACTTAQTAVWTGHFDNLRTSANTSEFILTPANVRPASFGLLGSFSVAGCVLAQPLYVPGVPSAEGPNVDLLFVATTTNMVYAFNARDRSLYFAENFGRPVPSTDIEPAAGYHDFPECGAAASDGPLGIVGTPVIDVPNNAMYFVSNTIDDPQPPHQYHHFLHKISLTTGLDLLAPVAISGTYDGLPFQSRYQLQRGSLLLQDGKIYVAFASHQDESPYQGWLFAYDTNLRQIAAVNYSRGRSGAGIWQSGGGPASDGKYVYFTTGNLADDIPQEADNSDSIVQVDPTTLLVTGKTSFYAEAENWDQNFDLDLGSSRVILMPGSGQAISGSKFGDLFLLNRNSMTLTARVQGAARHSVGFDWTGVYNGFAVWNNTVYLWPGGGGFTYGTDPGFPTDTLKAFRVDGSAVTMIANGQSDGVGAGYQGSGLSISANGTSVATGIVWAYTPASNTKELQVGHLHAYDAGDLSRGIFQELWNNIDPAHPDQGLLFAKMSQPTIADGKVYLPTFSGKVLVYGLLP